MSSNVNNLMYILRQLSKAGAKVEGEDAKEILLNNIPSSYNNVVFTLRKISSQKLHETITTLMAEGNRLKSKDTEENSPIENALFTKTRMRKKNETKGEFECYYYRKIGHRAWNWKSHDNDLLKGKESSNIAIDEYPLNSDDEFNG